MRGWMIGLCCGTVLVTCGSASAQPGGTAPPGFVPNFYNRQSQPLSPYLNLLRGGSPAVNYFYGVRPGLQSGGYLGPYAPQPGTTLGPRQSFFPLVDTLADYQPGDLPSGMAPTGHPVGFRNTLNYFGAGASLQQAQGMQPTGAGANTTGPRRGFLQQPTRR